jgi:hypothetical protein
VILNEKPPLFPFVLAARVLKKSRNLAIILQEKKQKKTVIPSELYAI